MTRPTTFSQFVGQDTQLIIDKEKIATELGIPLDKWHRNCHGISHAIVQANLFGASSRVARGWADKVGSQHSWVVLGRDCYNRQAIIVDPTWWTYNSEITDIWVGTLEDGYHHPHGEGNIFDWGKPISTGGEIISLGQKLSGEGRAFFDLLGPLDRQGWHQLSHAPIEGWPSAEIIEKMCNHPELAVMIPVDIEGMLTNRNPGGVYLRKNGD